MAGPGGKRPGAGRKPLPKLLRERDISAEIMASVDVRKLWREILESKSLHIRLTALQYLTDRLHGKPRQAIEHSNPDGTGLLSALDVIYVSATPGIIQKTDPDA